ncbi:MAG: dihydroorotate dehydrogenase [Acidimicrobiia bacterium]|nr:dihydroorotate dehydrogenase [Acidimicrobiia bacterium]
MDLTTRLGPLTLRTPLVAASGTVGSVVDFAAVGALEHYGAAVAKSVSEEPWPGRPPPRLYPVGGGMLNGIGIQNPGIAAWLKTVAPRLPGLGVPVWGSVVGHTTAEFARVAAAMSGAGVAAVEVNLSCPNLDDGALFALDAAVSAEVVAAVRAATSLPVGAKLSPNAPDIARVAGAAVAAGADFLVVANTVWGAALDPETRRPGLSGVIGGYSGPPIKPIALRAVLEVRRALPEVPLVGCGGVRSGTDVVEFLLAGSQAVAVGTAHFADPRAGKRIIADLHRYGRRHGVARAAELIGAWQPW